jgi:hypothetical protein
MTLFKLGVGDDDDIEFAGLSDLFLSVELCDMNRCGFTASKDNRFFAATFPEGMRNAQAVFVTSGEYCVKTIKKRKDHHKQQPKRQMETGLLEETVNRQIIICIII